MKRTVGDTMDPLKHNHITLAKLGAVTLFDIKGEITEISEPAITAAYLQATGQNTDKLLFKFNKGAYINSAGIAIFIQILAQAIRKGQIIGITGLSSHFTKIFKMLGITRFAEIHDNVQAAVETLNA